MAWHQKGDKPLSEPMLTDLIHWRIYAALGGDELNHSKDSFQLEPPERLRSEDTPPPPHDYPFYWVILDPKSEEDKVKVTNLKNSPKFQNKHYTQHTFWSCLMRCANMKWIQQVLLKMQSVHDSVHRRTDVQGETSIPPFQLRWSGEYNWFRIR